MKTTAYLDLLLRDESLLEIQLRSTHNSMELPACKVSITKSEIDKAVSKFWGAVGEPVPPSFPDDDLKQTLSKYIGAGKELSIAILQDGSFRTRIWEFAAACDQMVLLTNLTHVPWELLFNGDLTNGGFLGEMCPMFRQYQSSSEDQRRTGRNLTNGSPQQGDSIPIVTPKEIDGVSVSAAIASMNSITEPLGVFSPSNLFELSEAISNKSVSVLIAHSNEESGLELGPEFVLGESDLSLLNIPHGGIVILVTCKGAVDRELGLGLAAALVKRFGCVVFSTCADIELLRSIEFISKVTAQFTEISPAAILSSFFGMGITSTSWLKGELAPDQNNFARLFFTVHGGMNYG